ncbi:MAG: glycoside hydrolase family 5 protein [Propionibacteriaceae bacterium]|nr:glycoside hydrolase family 5 protein [Propionibacteriaceae bacterium]
MPTTRRPAAGYLRRAGAQVVDGAGAPVLLTGMAVGNWWLPEGYMWRFGDAVPSPRRIEAFIESMVGREAAAEFWSRYHRNYATDQDAAQMAAEGWNSVRIPLLARKLRGPSGEWDEENFAILDDFVAACARHGLYAILDLHGAPGGQTGTNIDDSPNNYPELFANPDYADETVAFWREIARRYRDNPAVGGYDLLNEPLPRGFQYRFPARLVELYRRLIAEIRVIDPHHLIILEGSNWARNWEIFDELWDDNVMLQFHKYWDAPDREHLRDYLAKRQSLDVPIWMGEGGENNLAWYQGSFQLYEDLGIGWNFWTWKRLAKWNAPCRVLEPLGWQDLVDHAYGGPKPSRPVAERALFELADNLRFERCEYRANVVNAITRRIPVRLEAEHFGYRGPGLSYQTKAEPRHFPGFRVTDDVEIVYYRTALPALDIEETSFVHRPGQPRTPEEELAIILRPGEWTSYEVNAQREGLARFVVRGRALDGGTGVIAVDLDQEEIGQIALDPEPRRTITWQVSRGRHHIALRPTEGRLIIDAVVAEWER